jgi:hypothetical protein
VTPGWRSVKVKGELRQPQRRQVEMHRACQLQTAE